MSNIDLFSNASAPQPKSQRRRPKEKSAIRNLIMILAALSIIGFLATKLLGQLSGAPEFPGPGSGSVQVVIEPGDSLAKIGNNLKTLGVVKSVDGFIAAANENPDSPSIAPGAYNLFLEMNSSSAILALLDPANRVVTKIVIPEGKRVTWIIETLAAQTGLPFSDFEAAITKAAELGLPDYANGNPEGFLFPATYEFAPGASADEMINTMLMRFNDEAKKLDLEARAAQMGRTTYEIVTVASLLEGEGQPRDFAKVARVVYNRLAEPMRLQFDSAVNYGLGRTDVLLTTELLNTPSDYNVYLNDGLTPSPINNSGSMALEAALNPESGDWLYFITTDLLTTETKFTSSYSEFLKFKDELLAFCDANPSVCY